MLDHYEAIRAADADVVWVGLGAPKQERWMAAATAHLPGSILFGVGAAFDYHSAGVQHGAPVGRLFGLEWLQRLVYDPRRLWRRYLVTNSWFVALVVREELARWVRRRSGNRVGPRS